jgi:hypothetical protein
MKKFIYVAALMFAFASCQKEDPIEPAPTPTQNTGNTGITEKNISMGVGSGFVTNQGYFGIPSEMFGTTLNGCGNTPPAASHFEYVVDQVYSVEFSVNSHGLVYTGDISFNSSGNLVEVTGNQTPGGATISVYSCLGASAQLNVSL